MRLFVLICIFAFFFQHLVLGQGISGKKPIVEDSLMLAREKQHQTRLERIRFYKKSLLSTPRKTLDSVYRAELSANRKKSHERLLRYKSNSRLDTLKELDLSYLGLKKVPEFVFEAKSLEVLVLDFNQIKKLPRGIKQLDNLKRLYWRGNALDDVFWIRIAKLGKLEKLDLSKNKLSRVPTSIRKIRELEELTLEENLYSEIPVRRLSRNRSIKILSFNRNHLPLQLGSNKYDLLSSVEMLKINNVGLSNVHPSFFKMVGLRELQLQENKIEEIPQGIENLVNLEKLSFYKNELTKISVGVFDLSKLTALDLYYNKIEVVPKQVGQLLALKTLYLSHNKIYSLPKEIGDLQNLQELYLHHNRLSALPQNIDQLKELRVFRVNENYLLDFPTAVLGLKQLKDLDISDNQIKDVPETILNLPSLHLYTMTNNPINFSDPRNAPIADLLFRLSSNGTIVSPRINKELIEN